MVLYLVYYPLWHICVNPISLLLLFWLPSDGLRNYFSQFGKVDACTIMRDPAGRSRGFAFLTFEDPAAVNAVMVREHYLDGKIVSFPPISALVGYSGYPRMQEGDVSNSV